MTKERIVNVCDRVIEACFYVLLVVITFSTSLVEIASSLLILSWVLKTVLIGDLKWVKPVPVKILFLLWIWVILSCINSEYWSESFRGIFKVLEYTFLFIIAATTVWKKDAIDRFLKVVVIGALFICANGFFQYFTGEGLIRHRTLIPLDYLHRISSSFVHPNDFGVYLLVVTSIFVSFILSESVRLRTRILFAFPFIISSLSLFMTRSRGAWLSFCAAFLVLGALRSKRIAATFLALLLVIFIMMPYTVQEHIFDLTNMKNGTTWERLMLWKGTINMIKVHPVLGFGVNTYSRNFPKYKPGEYPDVRYSHNCYLHMASEIGIIGALIFLVFLVTVFIYSARGILVMPPGRKKTLGIGLYAALAGFALNAMVDTHFYSVNLAVYFHILFGFCYSLTCRPEEEN
ncbi:MAG: O-antigen ligase family protein [Candidatus Omnitrophota bacterium]